VHELRRRLAERKAWEVLNPDLAEAWAEAMAIDHQRNAKAEAEARTVDLRRAIPSELSRCGFPATALEALRNVDGARQHLVIAKTYLSDPGLVWAAFLGSVGQGKTVAAAFIARELMLRQGLNNGPTGSDVHFCEFVRATTFARLSSYQADDKAYLERLCSVRLLVLDDLGTETLAGTSQAHLEELLDVRYSEKRRTVITSNLESGAFKARYGERISDRLRQCGIISSGKGESLRRRPT
jgi:DNA replication protein DnaC